MNCTDIDECAVDSPVCGANADCINTDGSFSCVCGAGFAGDGFTCTPITYICSVNSATKTLLDAVVNYFAMASSYQNK